MKKFALLLAGLAIAGSALAKLPPPTDEAKAKAAEAKDKAAWSDKVSAYQLCMSQDKLAARYNKAKGKASAPSACQNPGPYVAQTAALTPAAAPAATVAPAAAPAAAAAAKATVTPAPAAPAKK